MSARAHSTWRGRIARTVPWSSVVNLASALTSVSRADSGPTTAPTRIACRNARRHWRTVARTPGASSGSVSSSCELTPTSGPHAISNMGLTQYSRSSEPAPSWTSSGRQRQRSASASAAAASTDSAWSTIAARSSR